MSRRTRLPSLIPPDIAPRLMDQFTKADLAELAWDYCRQLDGDGATPDHNIYQQLLDRRELIIRGKARVTS
jgi:hypothetical protein